MGTLKSRQDKETFKRQMHPQKAELLSVSLIVKTIQGLSAVVSENRWYLTDLFNDFKNTT